MNGRRNITWLISTFWGTCHIFGADEARDFKFGTQVDRNEYYYVHVNILHMGWIRSPRPIENLGTNICQ